VRTRGGVTIIFSLEIEATYDALASPCVAHGRVPQMEEQEEQRARERERQRERESRFTRRAIESLHARRRDERAGSNGTPFLQGEPRASVFGRDFSRERELEARKQTCSSFHHFIIRVGLTWFREAAANRSALTRERGGTLAKERDGKEREKSRLRRGIIRACDSARARARTLQC
jgi:hypothetical protein